MSVILGIDPGLAHTGWGVVAVRKGRLFHLDHGAVTTSPKTSLPERLNQIASEIEAVIAKYDPNISAVEALFFAKNKTSAFPVAQARGAVLLVLARAEIPVREMTPPQIKQGITGIGSAEKSQVQEMVRLFLGLKTIPRPDHAADALAAAICCHHGVALS